MIALIIVGSIIAFFAILLSMSITLYVSYKDEDLKFKAGIAGIRIPINIKEDTITDEKTGKTVEVPSVSAKKEDKKSKKQQKKETETIENEDIKEKKSIVQTVTGLVDIIKGLISPSKLLLRNMRFYAVKITAIIGSDDAAETAENYGKMSALIYGGIGTIRSLFKTKVKNVFVGYDFSSTKSVYRFSFKLKIRAWIAMIAVFRGLKIIGLNASKKAKSDELRK